MANCAGEAAMKAFVRGASIVCAIAAFGLAIWAYMGVSMFGFPDGYVTDYQKAAETPLTIIAWASAGFGLVFLALAFSPIRSRPRTVAWLAAVIALVVLATAAWVVVPWYFGTHLGLDNGIGG
jgi:hypothetical protein